jgi:hypothetical protein
MQVGSATQMQHQMRMGGNAQGAQSQNGMKSVMQNLSVDDRNVLRDQMSSLSETDRIDLKSQLLQFDPSSMSIEDYTASILNTASAFGINQTTSTDSSSIEVYA